MFLGQSLPPYLREVRSATLAFRYRGGCSLSSMLFRWCMEDTFASLRKRSRERGAGFHINGERLAHILGRATLGFSQSPRQKWIG